MNSHNAKSKDGFSVSALSKITFVGVEGVKEKGRLDMMEGTDGVGVINNTISQQKQVSNF